MKEFFSEAISAPLSIYKFGSNINIHLKKLERACYLRITIFSFDTFKRGRLKPGESSWKRSEISFGGG